MRDATLLARTRDIFAAARASDDGERCAVSMAPEHQVGETVDVLARHDSAPARLQPGPVCLRVRKGGLFG